MNKIQRLINESLNGNLDAFKTLIEEKYSDVNNIKFENLSLKKITLISILKQLKEEKYSINDIQLWASFIRWDYIPLKEKALELDDIKYEDEEVMVEVIARLEELGDIIDGEMSLDEIDYFINILNSK